jgi:hypothetical protein
MSTIEIMFCEDCGVDVEILVMGDEIDYLDPESKEHVVEGHDLSSYHA